MDQRDFHCPYSLSSEITAKPTVLGLLVCTAMSHLLQITHSTAGQEDPFELDSNLTLSASE